MLPENETAVRLFLDCSTQWRRSMSGRRIGMDYPGVIAVMELLGIEDQQGTFERLQVLERELINIDQEKASNGKQD